MNDTATVAAASDRFELRFRSLLDEDRGLVFPCDAHGLVDMDRLPDRARNNFFRARALIGREFDRPRVAVTH